MRTIAVILHNLRSTHNVGSILRTSDGVGVHQVYYTGYTPYPSEPADTRLPHIQRKITAQLHKTALGAETNVRSGHHQDIMTLLTELRHDGYQIAALEQNESSVALPKYVPPDKLALIVGREVEGIESEVLAAVDVTVEIPMIGQKESYNVSVAAAMALYHCRFVA